MIDLKKGNVPALIIAVIVSAGGIYWQQVRFQRDQTAQEAALKATPVETFFEVKNVSVPNFIEGENPIIIYDRVIKKPFMGFWNVEAHMIDAVTDFNYCSGSGSALYTVKEKLPPSGIKLDWFMGKDCHLPAGKWVLKTNWEIDAEGYPKKFETFTSNIFTIAPKGSQLFLTPEQSNKLQHIAPQ